MANFDFIEMWKKSGREVGHSSFDLSKRQVLDLPASMLVPNFFLPTVPNEHHKINLSGLLRTETLNTAAFVNGAFHTNVFFVPLKQLWHNANDFISQKQDRHSSTLKGSQFAPCIRLTHLLRFIRAIGTGRTPFSSDSVSDLFGYDWAYSALRLLQYCKYGNYLWLLNEGLDDTDVEYYLNSLDGVYNADGISYKYVNLWRILAYQHIFYDYYRNKYYDEFPEHQLEHPNLGKVRYIDTFNLDDIDCSTFENSVVPCPLESHGETDEKNAARILNIFGIHYHQYKRDIYTSAMPSTQFGAVSSISLEGIQIVNEQSPSGATAPASVLGSGYSHEPGTLYFTNESKSVWKIANAFDILTFRKTELLQQWKQNALRSGNMVDDNFRSHYGVEPFYEEDNNVKFLGSFSCRLDINPITANASTGEAINGNVGDLAAIGTGSYGGNEIDFQCKDFGYIVAVTAFVPDVYYNANGIDKDNTLIEPFDYFYPEFENGGLEPITYGQQNVERAFDLNLNFGFVPPYSYLKTQVDEVYGEFSSIEPQMKKTPTDTIPSYVPHGTAIGSMVDWVVVRGEKIHNIDNNPAVASARKLDSLYIDPAVVNPIFGIEYDGTGMTNNFSLAISWDVKSIRPMSVLGLPQF